MAAIVISIPISLRRRGVEARLVVTDCADRKSAPPDDRLIELIASAHRALSPLASGDAGSINELAAQTGRNANEVTRLLPLAFLAPDIVTAIVDGRQPLDLTANRLRRRSPLPGGWSEQRRMLGFPDDISR